MTIEARFNNPFSFNGYEYSGRWDYEIIDHLPEICTGAPTWYDNVISITEVTNDAEVIMHSSTTDEQLNSSLYLIEHLTDPEGETWEERVTVEFVAIPAIFDDEEE